MAAVLPALLDDLAAETAALDAVLVPLRPQEWARQTPAAGWNIADQVSHLAYFDETALLAAVDPARFRRHAQEALAGPADLPDRIAAEHRDRAGRDLLDWFRSARQALLDGFASVDPSRRLPWYGPDMSPASSVTARLMETWAHGQAMTARRYARSTRHAIQVDFLAYLREIRRERQTGARRNGASRAPLMDPPKPRIPRPASTPSLRGAAVR